MEATLNFPNRDEANKFTKFWSRYSLRGHLIGKGKNGTSDVIIWGITAQDKEWIENYISKLNKKSYDAL